MGKPIKEYMMEQPEMMRRLSIEIGENIREVIQCVGKEFERIFLVGSGTSLNAALAARYVFEAYIQAEVQVFAPFDFLHYFPDKRLDGRTLLLGISQTVRSKGTIDCVEKARAAGAKTVFVTAEPENDGVRSAHTVLDTCTGEELVGAKTKGFTSTMAALYALAGGLAGKNVDLSGVSVLQEAALRETGLQIDELVKEFAQASSITLVGCGPVMAAVKEGGLKLLETVRIPVETYDVEEYMHGPYHCLENDSYMIFLAPPGAGQERMEKLLQFVEEITPHTLVLGNAGFVWKNAKNYSLALPEADEILAPLYYVIPIQWLAVETTVAKGRRPEVSRYPEFHKALGSKFMPKVNYYTGI